MNDHRHASPYTRFEYKTAPLLQSMVTPVDPSAIDKLHNVTVLFEQPWFELFERLIKMLLLDRSIFKDLKQQRQLWAVCTLAEVNPPAELLLPRYHW
jgi:hypothetical protein